jgi:KDO2-lipid IV(A) lauroyltransferase
MAKKPRSRLRNLAEYLFVRTMEGLLWPLPLSAMRAVGRFMGWLSWRLDRRHRVVAEENAAWALGLSPAEARRLVRRVYHHSGLTSVECLMLPYILRRHRIADLSRYEGIEHLTSALAKGRGVIFLTAHIGNWELGGLALAEQSGSLLSIARALDNPLLERHLSRIRHHLGQTVADRKGALRHIIQHLRSGGVVGLLIDQNQRKDGVFVDFFGRLASTTPSAAIIALRYDVPVVAGYACRGEDGKFEMHVDPPFELIRTGDYEADVAANTAQFTQRIEEWIRRYPGQWMWLHSRWKTRPPEEIRAMKAQRAAQAAAAGGTEG